MGNSKYSRPSIVKAYARKAQFGSIFQFDKKTAKSDGLFRTTCRGWYCFAHTSLSIVFWFGNLWHGARSIFKEVWNGVTAATIPLVEYGRVEKLGDTPSSTPAASSFL